MSLKLDVIQIRVMLINIIAVKKTMEGYCQLLILIFYTVTVKYILYIAVWDGS